MICKKKVLVISPVDPQKPSRLRYLTGGENTFTKTLLKYPLSGFKYIYYEEALKQKLIFLNPLTWLLLYLQKFRILPPGPRVLVLNLHKNFDLIYVHAHPVKIINNKAPLIISDSSSNIVFLKKYIKLADWQINIYKIIRKIIFRICKITDSESNPGLSKKIIVFSQWAMEIKKSLGIKNCTVIYPGLPEPKIKNKKITNTTKILFVGVWFERKGGRILLNVYRKLRKRFSNISLTILGLLPGDIKIQKNEKIIHKNYVSYGQLKQYYRTHDILVHIPPFIEGYGMTVTEAMSYGLAVIVSKICALPEFIEHQKSGLIIAPNSETALENALVKLIADFKFRQKIQAGARKRFKRVFSIPVFQNQLQKIFYEAVL